MRLAPLFAIAFLAACRNSEPPPTTNDTPAPVDHLKRGEIVEGTEKAFALALPRASKVVARFDTNVHVTSTTTPEELSGFVRARVKDGKVSESDAGTTELDDVIVPGEPTRRLSIAIRPGNFASGVRSEMIVRDTTPPPVVPGLSDEERWKRAGFSPGGKPVDPKQLQ